MTKLTLINRLKIVVKKCFWMCCTLAIFYEWFREPIAFEAMLADYIEEYTILHADIYLKMETDIFLENI